MLTNKAARDILLALYNAEGGFLPVTKFKLDDSVEKTELAFVLLIEAKLVVTIKLEPQDKPEENEKDLKENLIFARLSWEGMEVAKTISDDAVWMKYDSPKRSFFDVVKNVKLDDSKGK